MRCRMYNACPAFTNKLTFKRFLTRSQSVGQIIPHEQIINMLNALKRTKIARYFWIGSLFWTMLVVFKFYLTAESLMYPSYDTVQTYMGYVQSRVWKKQPPSACYLIRHTAGGVLLSWKFYGWQTPSIYSSTTPDLNETVWSGNKHLGASLFSSNQL